MASFVTSSEGVDLVLLVPEDSYLHAQRGGDNRTDEGRTCMERPRGLSVAMDLKNNPGTKYIDSIPSTFYLFPRTV